MPTSFKAVTVDEPPSLSQRRPSSKEVDQPPSLPSRHQTVVSTPMDDQHILPLRQQVPNATDISDSTQAPLSDSPLPQGWEHAYGTIIFIYSKNIN